MLTPASTIPLTEKRYYIISGQPQFYGKYNALHAPLNSVFHLQPLHTVDGRSASAAPDAIPDAPPQAELALPLPAAAADEPIRIGEALQLRSAFEAPLQAFEPSAVVSALQSPADSPPADDAPASALKEAPAPAAAARSVSNENEEAPQAEPLVGWSRDEPVSGGVRDGQEEDEDIAARSSSNRKPSTDAVAAEDAPEEEQQPSVAHARPTGVAVAGRGGLASAKPSATALVGDGGLAMASPMATAISGEFNDDEAKEGAAKEKE